MASAGVPSDSDREAFVAKLAWFRGQLGPREQQMLNDLVAAGRQAHEQGGIEVYWLGGPIAASGPAGDVWAPFIDASTFSGTSEKF